MAKLAIQIETVDALVAKFRERWDFEEDDLKMIDDFKASLAATAASQPEEKPEKTKKTKKAKKTHNEDGTERKKRAPSAYNMFVSEKRAELMAAGFKGKDIIREAARMWVEQKGSAPSSPPATDDAAAEISTSTDEE